MNNNNNISEGLTNGFNLVNKVDEFLRKNPEQKFTAREIGEWIFKTYPEECQKKKNRSKAIVYPLDTDVALLQQIIAEVGSVRPNLQKKNKKVKTTEGRPRKYYYTEFTDNAEIALMEGTLVETAVSENDNIKEHDLYPMLAEFLSSEFGIYSKRIDEKRSSNSSGAGANKWLYPDLVGMENFSQDWVREIKDCVQQYADKKTKLWSFEVKIFVNRSNIREAFFQAVSNSSWANSAYLVASQIAGDGTLKELRMLSSLHGIGFIKLDIDNLSESQIMIPAKERSDIDWHTANRLACENKDFMSYIKLVRQFYQTGEVRSTDWDSQILDN